MAFIFRLLHHVQTLILRINSSTNIGFKQWLFQIDWECTVQFIANISVMVGVIIAFGVAIFAYFELRDRRIDRELQLLNDYFEKWHSESMSRARAYLRRAELKDKNGRLDPEKIATDDIAREHVAYLFNFLDLFGILFQKKRITLEFIEPFNYILVQYWKSCESIVDLLRNRWNQPLAWKQWEYLVGLLKPQTSSSTPPSATEQDQ